jgi:hypothetical protein
VTPSVASGLAHWIGTRMANNKESAVMHMPSAIMSLFFAISSLLSPAGSMFTD